MPLELPVGIGLVERDDVGKRSQVGVGKTRQVSLDAVWELGEHHADVVPGRIHPVGQRHGVDEGRALVSEDIECPLDTLGRPCRPSKGRVAARRRSGRLADRLDRGSVRSRAACAPSLPAVSGSNGSTPTMPPSSIADVGHGPGDRADHVTGERDRDRARATDEPGRRLQADDAAE